MNYAEALDKVNKNTHLIGLKYRGLTIDEIIIYPSGRQDHDYFRKVYVETLDSNIAISMFKHLTTLEVGVVSDKDRIVNNSLLLETNIGNLKDEGLNVI